MANEELVEALTAVQHAADEATGLREELHTALRVVHTLKRLIIITLVGVALTGVIGVGLLLVLSQLAGVQEATKSCVDPTGECSKRTQQQVDDATQAITFRSERERLITEIGASDTVGNTTRSAYLKWRLDEVNKTLAELGQ